MFRNGRHADLDRHGIPQRAAAALTLAFALAACGGTALDDDPGDYGFPQAPPEPDRTVNVWVDAQRASAVKAFHKAHPEVRVKATTYDGNGWPDVVLSTQNNDAVWASQNTRLHHRSRRRPLSVRQAATHG